jgi:ABC-2 type transport system permease protein
MVIAGRTARRACRSGLLWGVIFGGYVASSALGYATTYPTVAQRRVLAGEFGSSPGFNALFGPAHQLQTVAGYTVWKALGVLSIVGAVWGLLTATRLLRGEEDAGRWELLVAGRTTRRGAAAQGLAGLGVGLAVLLGVTASIVVVVGRSPKVHQTAGASAFLAVALVGGAALFVVVGALCAQLAATRRQAATYAAGVLGASYALRLVADSGIGLAWLRWMSPLGWVEELQPLTDPHPVALVPIGVFMIVGAAATVLLAGRRDLGASTIADRDTAAARTGLLDGPTGLAVRTARPGIIGWWVAIAASALLIGLVAKGAGRTLAASSTVERALARLGARGTSADAYLGFALLIVAVVVALLAVGQVTAARAEEASGRLEHLVVRPVSRSRWLAGRLAVAVGAVLVAGVLAGVGAWVGAASQGASVSAPALVAAGLNLCPPALCLMGLGVLALGVVPRAASGVVYALVGWSFLVEVVGGVVGSNRWLLDTSVFHQMAAAPAVAPDGVSAAALVGVGVAAALVGGVAFVRRDLVGE